jgi:hypothetical protein
MGLLAQSVPKYLIKFTMLHIVFFIFCWTNFAFSREAFAAATAPAASLDAYHLAHLGQQYLMDVTGMK